MPISLEPMENERKKEKNDNEEGQKDKFQSYLKRELNDYRKRMGNKATFKGWVAHVNGESVILDKKIEDKDGDYVKFWEESSRKIIRTKKRL